METTFKKGDRVRLKAWVTKPMFGKGMERLFPQGCVGIVSYTSPGEVWSKGAPYVALQIPTLPKKYEFLVSVEDLELMPEQQVHVVKDGKMYELRKGEGDVVGVGDCLHCAFRGTNCSKVHNLDACTKGWYNYQEVKSGKLVS